MSELKKGLVSVIIPIFNAEYFLIDTLNTIKKQTYKNFEVILVDDLSLDKSCEIIEDYIKNNSELNINLIKLTEKSFAAGARNRGIEEARGNFICFLDADDLWDCHKLEKQVEFMMKNDCAFSFTGYEFADENGVSNGKKVYVPIKIDYKKALKNTTIWTSTVMFDMTKLKKENIFMPLVKRGQDTATWWKVLKVVPYAYGLNEILSFYRRTNESLSANKLVALKRTWNLYRNVEKLSFLSSVYNFSWYVYNAIKRRI